MRKILTREPVPIHENLDLIRSLVGNPYSDTRTLTREPGPVLGNLDLYLGTWTHTWEPGPVLGNLHLNRTLVGDP